MPKRIGSPRLRSSDPGGVQGPARILGALIPVRCPSPMVSSYTGSRRGIWLLLLVCVLLLGGPAISYAEIYKWTDADGQFQFSDRPPPQGGAEQVELPEINTYQGVSVEEYQDMRSSRMPGTKTKQVVMYSADWCGVCKRAKRFFQAEGIPFRELDVDKSRRARREFDRLNAKGVPVILVGGKRMNGFSEKRFMELYR